MLGSITLTEQESTLLAQVHEADGLLLSDHNPPRTIAAGEAAHTLFKMLLARDAIPESRLRYFADADYNGKNSRSSRRDVFLKNAGSAEEMYTHAHFWKYLFFFIDGASVPSPMREQFAEVACDEMREHGALSALARRMTRQLPGDAPTKAEEFFKLALDCDVSLMKSFPIRTAVMSVR
jgi:hypothetical protein